MKAPFGLSWGGLLGALVAGLAVVLLMNVNDPSHVNGYAPAAAALMGGLVGHGMQAGLRRNGSSD